MFSISSEWLLTGKGEMLKTPIKAEGPTQQVAETQAESKVAPITHTHSHWEGQIAFLQSKIEYLQEKIELLQGSLEDKDKVITALEKESANIEELKNTISRLERENSAIQSKPQNRATG